MSNNGKLLLMDAPHKVSSPFGYRIHPITNKPQGHNGVDYSTYGKCPPIYCPFDGGEVIKIGTDRYGAKFVYVGFKNIGYVGLAYHCSKINCHLGQKLNKGDMFAFVGTTGRSTGEHLHWSWIVYNNKWNKYYEADYKDFEKYIPRKVERDLTKQETIELIRQELNNKENTPSSWAKEAWDWGKSNGLTDGSSPKGFCTREQLVTMLKRFYDLIRK